MECIEITKQPSETEYQALTVALGDQGSDLPGFIHPFFTRYLTAHLENHEVSPDNILDDQQKLDQPLSYSYYVSLLEYLGMHHKLIFLGESDLRLPTTLAILEKLGTIQTVLFYHTKTNDPEPTDTTYDFIAAYLNRVNPKKLYLGGQYLDVRINLKSNKPALYDVEGKLLSEDDLRGCVGMFLQNVNQNGLKVPVQISSVCYPDKRI